MNDFYYALSLTETLYGISLQEEDWEEIAILAWNQIGNKRSKLYKYSTCLEPCQTSIELPCNVDQIEAVTTDFEDFQHVSNVNEYGTPGSFITEQYIESKKSFKSPYYISGKYIPYERVGNTLYFTLHFPHINILYKGQVLDDKGLPEITDKEAMAIATYVAYITKFKEALTSGNLQASQAALALKQQWLILCDLARVPSYLNQNEMDEILDVKNSWDRKIQNISYKPIK